MLRNVLADLRNTRGPPVPPEPVSGPRVVRDEEASGSALFALSLKDDDEREEASLLLLLSPTGSNEEDADFEGVDDAIVVVLLLSHWCFGTNTLFLMELLELDGVDKTRDE